jgi:hypothetical protein
MPQISDKSIGGTYMTLLNTISNIGMAWPGTLALYLIDVMSVKHCQPLVAKRGLNLPSWNNSARDVYSLIDVTKEIGDNSCSNENQIEVSWIGCFLEWSEFIGEEIFFFKFEICNEVGEFRPFDRYILTFIFFSSMIIRTLDGFSERIDQSFFFKVTIEMKILFCERAYSKTVKSKSRCSCYCS